MSVTPSKSILRQHSRSLTAAGERHAANAARRGDHTTGRVVESTGSTGVPAWPELVIVTEATPIDAMIGRYTAKYFGLAFDLAATGNLALADLGSSYGECEVWHAPDILAGRWLLSTHAIMTCIIGPPHSTRGKPLVVPIAKAFDQQVWLELQTVAPIGAAGTEDEFTANVFDAAYGGTQLYTTAQTAWNRPGYGNTATRQFGRDVVAEASAGCGQITGHVPLPKENATGKKIRYQAVGHEFRDDRAKWGFVINVIPDPIIHEE